MTEANDGDNVIANADRARTIPKKSIEENIANKKHSENADTSTSVTFDLEL